MASKTVKTYCRFCHAYCPMEATVEDNRLIALVPDTSNEIYGGYTCIKGRQLIEQIDHPTRLQASQKKQTDGSFTAIGSEQAMDEIAAQLQDILDKYGPRSIASYNGTYSYQNSAAHDVARAFHGAIGSPSYYTSVTIDQPAKVAIGPTRMGWWNGGSHMWNDSDVALIIGNNTLVSHFSIPGGIPAFSPHNALREGKQRGMKVICIDPRVTEVASRSDLHLQVRPGHDAAVVAAIIAVILSEDLHDKAFCEEHIEGLEQLAEQTQRFTPEAVAAAAGIPASQIVAAAQDVRRRAARHRRYRHRSGNGPKSQSAAASSAITQCDLWPPLPCRRAPAKSRRADASRAARGASHRTATAVADRRRQKPRIRGYLRNRGALSLRPAQGNANGCYQ